MPRESLALSVYRAEKPTPESVTIQYVIDGANRRVGKKVSGTLQKAWLYQNGLNVVAELDGNGAIVSRFVYGSRSNVPDYMVKNGITYRIISDQLGSVRLVVSTTDGSIAQRLDYDAWGDVVRDTNAEFQPFGFAGGFYDPDTKLVRFGVRDYDASVGRWTAKDPVVPAMVPLNAYAYVQNEPLNLIDLLGLYYEYSQYDGAFVHVDDRSGARTSLGKGYSGAPGAVNKHEWEDQRDVGPIPVGEYKIEPPNNRKGPLTFPLKPAKGRNPYNRHSFMIHGDELLCPGLQQASTGCIILDIGIRKKIAESDDRNLKVIP